MAKVFKKGDVIELHVDDLAFGARGIARLDDFVWFVERGIPGQKVSAKVRKMHRSYGEAYVEEVLEPSPHQVEPPCPYFGVCGGCQLQHLDYTKQVEIKRKQIKDILERVGGLKDVDVLPVVSAETLYGYRNKMEFTFSDRRWVVNGEEPGKRNDFALGFHVRGNFEKVLDIDGCLLQPEECNKIFRSVKELVLELGMRPYNIRSHRGFWRFLVIRSGFNTGEIMLNIVISSQEGERGDKAIDWIVHKLFWRHPEITTIIHSISDKKAQVAFGESERLMLGMGKITEKVGDKVYEISPSAFFQTNTSQTEKLFNAIVKLAEFKGDEIVYDLYSGTGAIGIFIADRVKMVLGIEVVESAVKDAKRNLELNNLKNVRFEMADIKEALKEPFILISRYGVPDVVILDPPRGGTHPKSIKGVLNLAPKKIVYVSCNPAILARDLEILARAPYRLKAVQPVDMFPHTGHIEVVTLLEKSQ